jgi:hypothetical protein
MKTAPSKEELTARLKELNAVEEAEQMGGMSAMCYCPAPPHILLKCELCGKEIGDEVELDWSWERHKNYIFGTVSKISSLGYDAKVQLCCRDCAKKLGKEQNPTADPKAGIDEANILFSFRINESSDYYRRIVNDWAMYEKLHALLVKEDFHIEDYRSYGYTPNEKIVFKYMTGLNPDE